MVRARNALRDGRSGCAGKYLVLRAGLLALLSAGATGPIQAAEQVTICYSSSAAALITLARQLDFYAAEGVDVELREYPSGKQAVEGLFAGQCELANSAEVPVVNASLQRSDFRIVAAIAEYKNNEKVIARSDRGIHALADLRGKRVAVTEFTGAHYFLDLLLAANGLSARSVSIVYLPAQDVNQAFRRGEVDAAALWEPNIQKLASEFGQGAKVFSAPGLHSSPVLLIGKQAFIGSRASVVNAVLRALVRAERFVKDQPTQARALMARSFEIAPTEAELTTSTFDFRVSLNQSMLSVLESAARWQIGLRESAPRAVVPNYLGYLHLDGLLKVKPQAVTIIH